MAEINCTPDIAKGSKMKSHPWSPPKTTPRVTRKINTLKPYLSYDFQQIKMKDNAAIFHKALMK